MPKIKRDWSKWGGVCRASLLGIDLSEAVSDEEYRKLRNREGTGTGEASERDGDDTQKSRTAGGASSPEVGRTH